MIQFLKMERNNSIKNDNIAQLSNFFKKIKLSGQKENDLQTLLLQNDEQWKNLKSQNLENLQQKMSFYKISIRKRRTKCTLETRLKTSRQNIKRNLQNSSKINNLYQYHNF